MKVLILALAAISAAFAQADRKQEEAKPEAPKLLEIPLTHRTPIETWTSPMPTLERPMKPCVAIREHPVDAAIDPRFAVRLNAPASRMPRFAGAPPCGRDQK